MISEFPPDLGVKSVGRFIAVGGGRGGVGKSLVAANLAVYFAQLGKSVVLVDADGAGANLHSHFGLSASSVEPDVDEGGFEAIARALVPTAIPGLLLLPAAHDAVSPGLALRAGRKMRWLAGLRALPAEYLVIDVGPGHADFAVDLMLAADIPIAVTVPEPPAVESIYRFLRAAFRRRLRRAVSRDRLRSGIVERAMVELGTLPSNNSSTSCWFKALLSCAAGLRTTGTISSAAPAALKTAMKDREVPRRMPGPSKP